MKSLTILTLALFFFLTWSVPANAHEVRPAYLRIHQSAEGRYETLWRVPAKGGMRLGIYLEMPEQCMIQGNPVNWKDGSTYVEQGVYQCPGGLVGKEIVINGLQFMLTDALARVERLDGTTQIARLTPLKNSFTVTATESRARVASTYLWLGGKHILLGIDHLLFVLALLLLVPTTRMLVWTITSFTLAHSIALAAATLGWVFIPRQPIEAVIALSILLVATEIVHWKQNRPGITWRWPWLVAFTFGLLHGLGFADALREIGLPEHAIPLALLFFNVGVEAGQLLFIACVLILWAMLKRMNWPQWAWRVPVYTIGSLAAFWSIDRITSFAIS